MTLAILSFVVTVGGFGAAIWQIRETKSAAEAAEDAATAIRRDMQKSSVVNRLSRAIALLEESRRFVRSGGWENASDRYSDATRMINESRAARSVIGQTDRSYLQSSITKLRGLMDELENWISGHTVPQSRDTADVNRRVTGIIADIQIVHSSARQS